MTRSGRKNEAEQEIDHAAEGHDEDRTPFCTAQEDEAQRENARHHPIRAAERDRAAPQRVHHNEHARRRDHRHDRRAQRREYALQRVQVAVFEVQPRDERHQNARRQNAPDRRYQRPGQPRQLVADDDRAVHGDRPGRRLRDGDQIEHLRLVDPVKLIHKTLFHQRNDHIPAAERKRAETERG